MKAVKTIVEQRQAFHRRKDRDRRRDDGVAIEERSRREGGSGDGWQKRRLGGDSLNQCEEREASALAVDCPRAW